MNEIGRSWLFSTASVAKIVRRSRRRGWRHADGARADPREDLLVRVVVLERVRLVQDVLVERERVGPSGAPPGRRQSGSRPMPPRLLAICSGPTISGAPVVTENRWDAKAS
jgi:hypothetical protein